MSTYTAATEEILRTAQAISAGYKASCANTSHLMLALATDGEGAAALLELDISPEAAVAAFEAKLGRRPGQLVPAQLVPSPRLGKILQFAYWEGHYHLGCAKVTPAALVLALVRENECDPGRWLNDELSKLTISDDRGYTGQGKNLPYARKKLSSLSISTV